MLPKSNSLRTLNSWLCGTGYQIAQKGSYICINEHGLRPVVAALAKATRRAVNADVEIPTGESDGSLAYPSEVYNAADNLEKTAADLA